MAESGELASELDSNTLSLILKNGNYYEDIQLSDGVKERINRPFAKALLTPTPFILT